MTDAAGATVATGAMADGDDDGDQTDTFCVVDGCYAIAVGGGAYLSEKSWNLGGDLPGAAPADREFRVELVEW